MKILILIAAIAFTSLQSFAQKAMTFDDAKKNNINLSELDKTYKSGTHTDISLAVFKTNEEEYIAAYHKLLNDFGKYLTANKFYWETTTKGFNRIYFDKSGKIDYFFYNFNSSQLTFEQKYRFNKLLNDFIKNYKFALNAKVNFSQCSPITYMPNKK